MQMRVGEGPGQRSALLGHVFEGVEHSFDDLPQECAALVLAKCCPRDAGRLACVSRTWAAAAATDDTAWHKWSTLRASLQDVFPRLKQASTGREALEALRLGAFSHSRGASCKEYLITVDPATGNLALHVSAFRCLYFFQRNDMSHSLEHLHITPYGLWPTSAPGGTFEHAAALAAGLFHIRGEICLEFPMPAGKYSLAFRIAKPLALQEAALFPAVCMVNQLGEPDFVKTEVDLHRDGAPSPSPLPQEENGVGKAAVQADTDALREPEFWAKSPSVEREQQSAWETINSMVLRAYSSFSAEAACRMRIGGERVKPWKHRMEALPWEEFYVGEVELKAEVEEEAGAQGKGYIGLDIVLTDVETYTFQEAIWIDSVILRQVGR